MEIVKHAWYSITFTKTVTGNYCPKHSLMHLDDVKRLNTHEQADNWAKKRMKKIEATDCTTWGCEFENLSQRIDRRHRSAKKRGLSLAGWVIR